MTPRAEKTLTEWRGVNGRLLLAKFKSKQCNRSIIVCYAPTNDSPEERKVNIMKNCIYCVIIDEIPERDKVGKVGRKYQGKEKVMGENENGAHILSFCSTNNLVIGGTLFQHKAIYNYTWTSPCGTSKNQIGHIAINKERRTLRNVRSYSGADIGSDPQLHIAALKLKLKAPNRNVDRIPRFDTSKLLENEPK
ncbi:craniofacial development protein 2-like [Palaemon carinicauda]|uniref:craniofacial development protein 2-like n=1 Tax=Palaemon carinicauda TaxID=392227 RepID=UPI0035B5C212